MRKIIQIALDSLPETEGSGFFQDAYALCDDGTFWLLEAPAALRREILDKKSRGWRRLPDIPQEDEG